MTLTEKLLGTYSSREIKRLKKKLQAINGLEMELSTLSDDELANKTIEFKAKLKEGKTLDSILPEAFAVCREASKRILGMRHFDVQLIGGMILHQGRVAEMKTGEGKTLVATLPAYLHALEGKGVQVVTVNDYLAQRDCDTMKPLYNFLGVSVAVITNQSSEEERRDAYNSDITYVTNSELGFDYLRDHMVLYSSSRVQRGLNFAIVDEVDSILIDEARTPLIISGSDEDATDEYVKVDIFAKTLKEEDYSKDEKLSTIYLTESGVEKAERFFNIEAYTDLENSILKHHVDQAIRANYTMKKDKDYLVRGEEVLIIDEFTGRVSDGRRFSDGLHQAIEAKEGVPIKPENKTLATITYQSFFKLYKRISGMTGTAKTEEQEFREIYGLDVIEIPTNKPMIRLDHSDKIYLTEEDKLDAILVDIEECHRRGQPVLAGTSSIEKSENLSRLLSEKNIPHKVLNAKNHESEAQIIANAGEASSVTIATNMAGRGTDIKLGDGVSELGGLKIIGTERHENRRIDNQLRGRSGRQGDAGESIFYLSFEDDLMRVFSSDKAKKMVGNMSGNQKGIVIENKFLVSAVERAQRNIEHMHFQTRKETISYDNIINLQRELIYAERDKVVDGIDFKSQINAMIDDVIKSLVDRYVRNHIEDDSSYMIMLDEIINRDFFKIDTLKNLTADEIEFILIGRARQLYRRKTEEFGAEDLAVAERQTIISFVDQNWRAHLDDVDELKKSVKLRAYNQHDPLKEFIMESGKLFERRMENIKYNVVKTILMLRSEHKKNLIYEKVS